MLNFFPILDCKRAYHRFVKIAGNYSNDNCAMYHIGATYMSDMVGNPTIDILVIVDDLANLPVSGQPFRISFDKKLHGLQDGDVLYYIGLKSDRKHLLRYKYLTEYINSRPELKAKLSCIKKRSDDFAKSRFFNSLMDDALVWRKQKAEGPIPVDERYPLPVTGQETCFLKNFITRSNIEVGDYTYYNSPNYSNLFENNNVLYHFDPNNKLIIGKFCSLASGTTFIMSSANHQMDGSTYPFAVFSERWARIAPPTFPSQKIGNTVVGNDVWIGMNATIMPGVKIGDGAIIAANATVAKDVPPYHLAGGCPAKIIKPRFEKDIIEFYEALKWWDWPIEKIEDNMSAIINGDVDALKGVKKVI